MKMVITDLRKLYLINHFVIVFSIMLIITHFRMLRELTGAIMKNMTLKSDFELILQSLQDSVATIKDGSLDLTNQKFLDTFKDHLPKSNLVEVSNNIKMTVIQKAVEKLRTMSRAYFFIEVDLSIYNITSSLKQTTKTDIMNLAIFKEKKLNKERN